MWHTLGRSATSHHAQTRATPMWLAVCPSTSQTSCVDGLRGIWPASTTDKTFYCQTPPGSGLQLIIFFIIEFSSDYIYKKIGNYSIKCQKRGWKLLLIFLLKKILKQFIIEQSSCRLFFCWLNNQPIANSYIQDFREYNLIFYRVLSKC